MSDPRGAPENGQAAPETSRKLILIAFDEIALKRAQRGRFIEQLRRNILAQLGCESGRLNLQYGRLELGLEPGREEEQWAEWAPALARVFGIKWFARAEAVAVSLEALEEAVLRRAVAAARNGARSFKLEHSRKDKQFPLDSYELNCRIGAMVLEAAPELRVDVHNPELLIRAEIRRSRITVFAEKQRGAEGLPLETTGAALALLSGGIDSPVAAWYVMRRGLRVEYLHFHSPPYTGLKAEEKVRDLIRVLNRWAPRPARLFLVPFTRIQEEIADRVPAEYWTIVQRRFMQQIGGSLAERYEFDALVAGDSIGQVASQTLANMAAIDAASRDFVLRPLLGFDKDAIIACARRIDTYEISIRPYEDCCVLFAPPKPAIRCNLEVVEAYEQRLERKSLQEEALEATDVISRF